MDGSKKISKERKKQLLEEEVTDIGNGFIA